ncbi:amino acid ABC transporter permease [Segeticoccus rhizosphaerae]|uniref:amino acid ABC transporter permease n=1 Tax=Segeticoccus rhizosphaerae TaxID=1104777 RepID=UPI00126465D6|nr:amino acid ABC transporter permease [Segeticoccus rhizosphaerae]
MTQQDGKSTTLGVAVIAHGEDEIRVVPRRMVGRWIGAAVVSIAAAWVIYQLVTNPAYDWGTVWHYFLDGTVLQGLWMTLLLTALTMVAGALLGVLLAIMRLSGNPVMTVASTTFIWFFRGTPALVQLIFWFNLATLFPQISLGIPFGGPAFWSASTNALVTPFIAAMLGLGLNEGAYMAEIVRGGILSVDRGQDDAVRALGLRPWQGMRRIVLPQAMRSIIPATGNQTIGMLKYTSLASIVALHELLYSVQTIYNVTFQTIPLLIVASVWYLILTTVLSLAQVKVEQHFSRGERGSASDTRGRWGRLIHAVVTRGSVRHA